MEETLIENGFAKVAKAYILYRRKRQEAREALQVAVNVEKLFRIILSRQTGEHKKILTLSYSYPGLVLHVAGSVMAHYTLNQIYPDEVKEAHVNGDIHIHDLS